MYRLFIPASVFPVHACLHILEINTCGGSYRWQSVVNHLLIFQDDAEGVQIFLHQQSKSWRFLKINHSSYDSITLKNLYKPENNLSILHLRISSISFLRLSSSRCFCTTSEYCLTDSLSSGLWNNMRKGRPSSVNSSAFSNVISLTRGEHLSATQALISSYLFLFKVMAINH